MSDDEENRIVASKEDEDDLDEENPASKRVSVVRQRFSVNKGISNVWYGENITESELQRLKVFETSGRINETLIEVLDFWTDLAFVATLYVFSQDGNPGDSFLGFLVSSSDADVDAGEVDDRDRDLFFQLFIVSAVVMLFNIVANFIVAMSRFKYTSRFTSLREWLTYFVGILVCQIEPHNGLLFIDRMFKDLIPAVSDYSFAKTEIRTNLLLLVAEQVPQFIVQSIFAFNVANQQLTVTWFVAILLTLLKLLGGFGNIIFLYLRLRALKKELSAPTSST